MLCSGCWCASEHTEKSICRTHHLVLSVSVHLSVGTYLSLSIRPLSELAFAASSIGVGSSRYEAACMALMRTLDFRQIASASAKKAPPQ